MESYEEGRPDPDRILQQIRSGEPKRVGRLKIFFGYAAGVGKTYAMLDDAQEQLRCGVDVVAGYVEPHTRPETTQLLSGLPALPPKRILHKGIELKEFDLDLALERKPELILVDELAHTNAESVRNRKRYQDIEELLQAGIDVYTTVNVQHLESLNDIVQGITQVHVRETIPDSIFDQADKVKLIDIEPEELLKRLDEGKVYRPERARVATEHFFTQQNLRLLREIAMRKAADRVSHDPGPERRYADKSAGVKLLVCISASPSSAKSIRWTARMAEAFHAPWTALYVETVDNELLREEDRAGIRANMELAERLGADIIVTLNGHEVAPVVAEYARHSGITNIVVGKSRNRRTLPSLFESDLSDKLIERLGNIELHIIADSTAKRNRRRRAKPPLARHLDFSWGDALKTLAMLIMATLVSLGLRAVGLGERNVMMIYILSVLVVSRVTRGYVFGVVASVFSVLCYNYLFTEPYFTLNAIQAGYPITFLIMLIVALITSALTVRIKTQARLAAERERRTEVLYEINKKLLVTRGLEPIVALTNDYMVKLFHRSAVFYTEDPVEDGKQAFFKQAPDEPDSSYLLTADERAVAHWVFANQKRAGAGTDTLRGAGGFYMPVISQGQVLGVIGLSCTNGRALDQNNRIFLRMIASQVAMALERQSLSDEQRNILIQSEKEKMRSNLLRAISHDLRTPLTGILGASSVILENESRLDPDTRRKLISDIKEDSQWLIRLVENLLSVTRINENGADVAKTPEAVEEIVAEAISRIRKRFPGRKITVKIPDELLLVPMDGTLIEQVLINLVENAAKHSGPESLIDVSVRKQGLYAVFEVSDNGEGIPEQDLPHLFESYVSPEKRNADSSRGMGIGLSICMSIIRAHGGRMEAGNKPEGGAILRFTLPIKGSESP
ncbi:sensor histidine kinase [Gorillibacterium timonense]|uniref:sensor histidine kinase n=1 Tax=Gorillibacterium timonense TaxID=1689269 RepID=UPI00071D4D75|nr:sensor histidine kinase KdpD [Gorillibacterium timonense]